MAEYPPDQDGRGGARDSESLPGTQRGAGTVDNWAVRFGEEPHLLIVCHLNRMFAQDNLICQEQEVDM
ncbi:unnamed protein product [Rangifer tarandus platyrhynchus]|uniref:Uncharacterized protein n=2 Tax=Rangifer tarandus platyrhynchus TaxID=3082113 RepID=A0ABN8ZBM5_RANTA|nr:unnamed protein product [Rangifer tarandus platyrhynchus]CAI9688586.1 unnamed protein product [Rangifer tarandus platyrhynchus]